MILLWLFIFTANAQVITEEGKDAFIYMGVSDGKSDLSVALREAYQEAVREAVMHQFGVEFSHSEVSSTIDSKDHSRSDSDISTPQVALSGIKPVREKIVQKDNGAWLVHRWISYDKQEIAKEKSRLKKKIPSLSVVKHSKDNLALGLLEVVSIPDGVRVLLTSTDQDLEFIGTSPVLFNVPIGKYTMTLNQANFLPLTQEVIVSGSKITVKPRLERGMLDVRLNVTPKYAQVYVNGLAVDTSTVRLPVGTQTTIRAEHHNYETQERSITPWYGDDSRLELKLSPKPGVLSILSQPSGAEVFVDKRYLGRTPLLDQQIAPGHYDLHISLKGYETEVIDLEIEPNKRIKPKNVTLSKAKKREQRSPSSQSTHQRFYLTYLPLVSSRDQVAFHYLPLHFEYRPYWFLSYHAYFMLTEKEKSSSYEKYVDQGFGLRLYLLDYYRFRLSVGVQYAQTKETNKHSSYGKVVSASKFSHVGPGADLQIPLSTSLSLKVMGQQMIDHSGKHNRYMLGLTFEF